MMEEAACIDAAHGHAHIAQAAPGLPQAAAGELRPLPQPVVGLDEPQLYPIEPELDGGVQNTVQGPGRASQCGETDLHRLMSSDPASRRSRGFRQPSPRRTAPGRPERW